MSLGELPKSASARLSAHLALPTPLGPWRRRVWGSALLSSMRRSIVSACLFPMQKLIDLLLGVFKDLGFRKLCIDQGKAPRFSLGDLAEGSPDFPVEGKGF